MSVSPEISVCIFSYNFGRYLEQAIDSVLAQKISVPYEIVIGDDRSTDGSQKIIAKFHDLYPDLIRPIFNNENIGGTRNWLNTISACRGKYIALLDGDDYFVDPYKLQKQYDFLQGHIDYVVCFHAVREIFEEKEMGQDKDVRFEKKVYHAGDFIERGWFIRTGTMFFRNGLLPEVMPEWIYGYTYRLDSIIPVFLGAHGASHYLDEICSVWRKHSAGMSYQLLEDEIQDTLTRIELSHDLDEYTKGKYRERTNIRVAELYTSLFFSIIRSGIPVRYVGLLLKTMSAMNYSIAFNIVKNRVVGAKEA